jgi:hypothetical protein
MIATMNPLAWCFNVTRLGHRAEGSTMGELATMAAPSTNTKRRTVHCSKHAFAPIASFRPKNAVAPSITLPAQRHQSSLSRAGLASESPFTGDDPVNGVDPLGLFWGQGTLDKWRHEIASNADTQWNAIKSFGSGFVGTPSGCNTNMATYDAGNIAWWVGALGGPLAESGSDGDDGSSGGDDGVPGPEAEPGAWATVGESMSARAAAYQEQITGVSASESYVVNGVKFDGYSDGVLQDAKGPGYANFVTNGEFDDWYQGQNELASQAERQLSAADGIPITWSVAQQSAAEAIQNLFADRGISGINVVYIPPAG